MLIRYSWVDCLCCSTQLKDPHCWSSCCRIRRRWLILRRHDNGRFCSTASSTSSIHCCFVEYVWRIQHSWTNSWRSFHGQADMALVFLGKIKKEHLMLVAF